MKILARTALAATALAGAIGMATAASAQQVEAIYTVQLTDPATGANYYVTRDSLRSWPAMRDCEQQKETFSGYHTDAIEDIQIRNEQGQELEVGMASIECAQK